MENFLQLLVYGLQLGSIYALLAIGYTMVFGIIKMINMAHCDFLMMGCYIVYFLVSVCFGGELVGPAVALLLVMVVFLNVLPQWSTSAESSMVTTVTSSNHVLVVVSESCFLSRSSTVFHTSDSEFIGYTPFPFCVYFSHTRV